MGEARRRDQAELKFLRSLRPLPKARPAPEMVPVYRPLRGPGPHEPRVFVIGRTLYRDEGRGIRKIGVVARGR